LRDKNLPGIFIFLLPPSWRELKRRLSNRRTEGKAAMEDRLKKAKNEMAEARWYDYVIVNDRLEMAREQLRAIILAEHCRRERMMQAMENLIVQK